MLMKVTGYWTPEMCNIWPHIGDLYFVFVCPFTRDSDRLNRTECVGFAMREEIAQYIHW